MKLTEILKEGQRVLLRPDGSRAGEEMEAVVRHVDPVKDLFKLESEMSQKALSSAEQGKLRFQVFQEGAKGYEGLFARVIETEDSGLLTMRQIYPRHHVRVDGYLPLVAKRLDPSEYEESKNACLHNGDGYLMSHPSLEGILRRKELSPKEGESFMEDLFNLLVDIRTKLDLVLNVSFSEDTRNLLSAKPQMINIRGSGIAFHSRDRFMEGDLLEIRLLLPIFPLAIIRAIGRVVAVSQDWKRSALFRISIRFEAISDDSREKIIRYSFQRQREMIRENHHSS